MKIFNAGNSKHCCLSSLIPVLYLILGLNVLTLNFANAEDGFLKFEQAYPLRISSDGEQLQLNWQIAEGYYLYADKIALDIHHDNRLVSVDIEKPPGKMKFDENFDESLEVHYNALAVTADLSAYQGPHYIRLKSQGCAESGLCYPPKKQYFKGGPEGFVEVTKDTFASFTNLNSNNAQLADGAASEPPALFLPWMLFGAFLGGFILNLMPCVFPVLSLKALSLASGDANSHHKNGWAYTAGVVVSFMAVAIIIIVAKSTGESLGWGFQLQQPIFVGAMVYLFVLLGLNLAGLFEMGTSFMGVGNKLTQGDGTASSFFTGVLAAVVASPCTAPFMASAVGFAVTQNAYTALLVFAFLGFGLAAPYLLLCYLPAVANKMPSPGPWMNRLKQGLSFPMFLTSAWLLGVLGSQTSAKTAAFVVAGIVAMTFTIWILQGGASGGWKWINRSFGSLTAVAALWILFNVEYLDNDENSPWIPYSEATITSLREENRAIFVDLTADWCITCKVNENVAINRDAVSQFAEENNIALVKGDWTKSDPKITEYLESFNRNGVPLYVMYSKDTGKAPQLLPQILTEELVLDAMRESIQ